MSPKPADFDRAIEDLNAESASAQRRCRALDAAAVRHRGVRLRLAPITAGALCLLAGIVLVVPSRGSGLAWAVVVQRTNTAPNIHEVSYDAEGRKVGERWNSGQDYAYVGQAPNGRVRTELRRDHRTLYFYLATTPLKLPNAYYYAQLMESSGSNHRFPARQNTVAELISDKRTVVKRHERVESGGKRLERYWVKLYRSEDAIVDADGESGRVLQVSRAKGETSVYDYPETIAPSVFSWRARLTKDVPVLDARASSADSPYQLPAPIARSGEVQLRTVEMSPFGSLYVTWTGGKYSREHKQPFQVVGVKTDHPWYGPGPLLDAQHRKIDAVTVVNLAVLEKIGSRVTLRISVSPETVAEFKNVRVARLKPLK